KLIPKCYVLKYYQLETENAEVSVEQSLPSGDLYSGAMAGKPDFSFAVKYAVTYKIKEDSLYAMATSGTLGDGGLSQFYAAVKEKIQNTAASLLGEEMSKALNGSTFSQKTLEDAVKARIGDQIADVEIISFETAQARFPDVELYKAAKAKYMENLEKKQELEEKQQEISAQQEKEKEDMNSKIEQRIELLKKYGELLTQYPILIEYFKSKNESLLPEDIKIEDIIK
ncbi:MAG: hypothetical protein IJG75_03050, partial [Spirochaetia bacterium]|nr:hypothetical protein [Spirochaetia bacterium]